MEILRINYINITFVNVTSFISFSNDSLEIKGIMENELEEAKNQEPRALTYSRCI